MLDSVILQDLGKYIFQYKNIFWATIPILGYIFMQNNTFLYKYTLLGFLYGLVVVPLAGGIFSFLNNYGIISFFLFYVMFVFILQQKDFIIYKSLIYAFGIAVLFLMYLYLHFIPLSFFDMYENIYKILIVLGLLYGIFYAFIGYIFDCPVQPSQ